MMTSTGVTLLVLTTEPFSGTPPEAAAARIGVTKVLALHDVLVGSPRSSVSVARDVPMAQGVAFRTAV